MTDDIRTTSGIAPAPAEAALPPAGGMEAGGLTLGAAPPGSAADVGAPDSALHFLAEASVLLASSLDPPALLDAIARYAVPRLGDLCLVDLVDGDVHTRRIAAHQLTPGARAVVDRVIAVGDPLGPHGLLRRVLSTGEPIYREHLTTAEVKGLVGRQGEEMVRLAGRLEAHSYLMVPLAARGAVLGALTFVTVGERAIGPADVDLARELAARAAVAIDNARQYAALQAEVAQRRAAERALGESERTMRTLLQNLPGVAYRMRVDPFWTAEFLSEGGATLTGYTTTDFLENRRVDWEGIIHPEDRSPVRDAVLAAVTTGRPFQLTYRIVTAAGATRWVWEQGCGVGRDAAGVPIVEGFITDVNERHSAEAALRASEERYRVLARATSDVVYDWVPNDDRIAWGDAVSTVFGYDFSTATSFGWWVDRLHPDDRERVTASLDAAAASDAPTWRAEYRFRRQDGSYAHVLDRCSFQRDATGRVVRAVGAMADATKERELEAQLRQAQKMEAVGQLAGGVAHDFNNLLSAIIGGVDLARAALPPASQPAIDLADARDAATRAAQLTRQLLAFSRKPVARTGLVDLNAVVAGSLGILRRLVGDAAVLDAAPSQALATVQADPGQLEQVLLNLVVNARDAVLARGAKPDEPGLIAVEVTRMTLAEGDPRLRRPPAVAAASADRSPLAPGAFVAVVVRDNGVGMDAATRDRAAEPFFTSKAEGTGLGLATVFGVAGAAGGTVQLESAPDRGTAVTVFFPAAGDAPEAAIGTPASTPRGSETVLLVEDEAVVRATARRILERGGYTVLEAQHGADALLLWRERGGAVDLVVTDARMPVMGGPELLARLRAERPDLPAVLMSGYPGARRPGEPEPDGGVAVLAKPFAVGALLTAVRSALDRSRA